MFGYYVYKNNNVNKPQYGTESNIIRHKRFIPPQKGKIIPQRIKPKDTRFKNLTPAIGREKFYTDSSDSTDIISRYSSPAPPTSYSPSASTSTSYTTQPQEQSNEIISPETITEVKKEGESLINKGKSILQPYFDVVNYLKDKYDIPRWLSYSATVILIYKLIK